MSLAAPRAQYLDLFKTLLVWGMVTAHVIQLLGFRLPAAAGGFSDYINLVSFSGFMLAFGIGTGLSPVRPRRLGTRLWPALVMLLAVYLSSLGFALLVDRKPLTPDLLLDLLSFRRLFGYSEFLASFFVLYLVIALARPLLVGIGDKLGALAVAIALCLASTALTTDQLVPFAGTLIGHTRYASFPLLAYLPWFLVGIRIGQRDGIAGPLEVALAVLASGLFLYGFWRMGYTLPERFPPSILWVIGPGLPLLIYLVACRGIADLVWLPPLLLAPGRHVLAALLLSNLAIFTTGRLIYKPAHLLWAALAIGLVLLVAVTLWCAAIDGLGDWRRMRHSSRIPDGTSLAALP